MQQFGTEVTPPLEISVYCINSHGLCPDFSTKTPSCCSTLLETAVLGSSAGVLAIDMEDVDWTNVPSFILAFCCFGHLESKEQIKNLTVHI